MAGIQEAFNNFVNRVAQKEQSKTLPKVMIEIPQQHPHIQDMGIMKRRFGLSSGGQPPVTTGFEGLPPISDTPPPPQQVNPNTYALRNTAQTQGFVQSNQPTSSYPTATPLTQGLPLYFNQSVTNGAINPLSYLSQGNNLLSATPDQIVQQNNQKQQQAIAAAQQGIGQQSPTWYGAKGGRVGYADGSEDKNENNQSYIFPKTEASIPILPQPENTSIPIMPSARSGIVGEKIGQQELLKKDAIPFEYKNIVGKIYPKEPIYNIETKQPDLAITKITPKENNFLKNEFFKDRKNLEIGDTHIRDVVPSITIDKNNVSLNYKDLPKFKEYLSDLRLNYLKDSDGPGMNKIPLGLNINSKQSLLRRLYQDSGGNGGITNINSQSFSQDFKDYIKQLLNNKSFAKGGRAGYADGSEELDPNLERLSKSKSYSEKELLSNLNAKMSNRPTLEDIIYYGSPMVEPSYIVPKNSTSNMPVIREGTMNFPMQQLADGGQVETHLTTTTPPQHGPNPYGVASMFKQRYT